MKLTKTIKIHLDALEKQKVFKEICLHHLGVEECNIYDHDKDCYVAAFPEKETQEFKEAFRNINLGVYVKLELNICPKTGEILFAKVLEKEKQ